MLVTDVRGLGRLTRAGARAALAVVALLWAAAAFRDSAPSQVVDGLAAAQVAQAAPHEQAAPAERGTAEAVELSSGDLALRVRRQPWAIEARVSERVVFRELDATGA